MTTLLREGRPWLLATCALVLWNAGCEATSRDFGVDDAGVTLGPQGGSSGGTNRGEDAGTATTSLESSGGAGGGAGGTDDGPNSGQGDPLPVSTQDGETGGGAGGLPSTGGEGGGGGAPAQVAPTGGVGATPAAVDPYCGDGNLDEGEACDPGGDPSTEAGQCSGECELNACAENSMRACSDGGALGHCGFGMQLCQGGTWTPCDVEPEAMDTCDPGDDADCDGTANEGCGCVAGSTQKCSVSGAQGNCALGDQTCGEDGQFGPCSIQPASADSCDQPGDDANCDGTPNDGCTCTTGEEQDCGPTTEAGVCAFGVTRCEGGSWTSCQGAVFPAARDCRSSADNDCDGSPDNTVSGTCTCAAGTERACDTHPGRDGNGMCVAGEQTCDVSANGSSSFWGTCTGAVAPQPADSCSVVGDDGNCDGTPNGGCNCLQGETTTCSAEYGRLGDCGSYSLTCGANGAWPLESSACTAQTGDSCAAAGQCVGGVWDSPTVTFDSACFQ